MSTSTYCDQCRKKQLKDEEGWLSISIHGSGKKLRELLGGSWGRHFDLCDKCTTKVLKSLLKILEKKKKKK